MTLSPSDLLAAKALCERFDRAEVSPLPLAGLVPGLIAEIERLRQRVPCWNQCEWFVSQDALSNEQCGSEAWCIGETSARRSQYWLCEAHAKAWNGSLVGDAPQLAAAQAEVERLRAYSARVEVAFSWIDYWGGSDQSRADADMIMCGNYTVDEQMNLVDSDGKKVPR